MRRKEMQDEAKEAPLDGREKKIREKQKRLDLEVGTSAQITPSQERSIEDAENRLG